jgi:hypothetical protein
MLVARSRSYRCKPLQGQLVKQETYDILKILDKSTLITISCKQTYHLLIIHTTVDCPLGNFEPIGVDDWKNGAGLGRVNVFCGMLRSVRNTANSNFGGRIVLYTNPCTSLGQYLSSCRYIFCQTHVAVGPVSASPSPTMQATIKSGLSITAPKATDNAYPSSPPS